MPLLYYARQSQLKTKDGVKQWHLTLKKVGRAVSLQQLGEMVAEKCSATPGDVHNVIRNLMSVMRMQLLNSRTVRLDGLGTFTVIARTRGKGVDNEKDVNPNQVSYWLTGVNIWQEALLQHYSLPCKFCRTMYR